MINYHSQVGWECLSFSTPIIQKYDQKYLKSNQLDTQNSISEYRSITYDKLWFQDLMGMFVVLNPNNTEIWLKNL